MTHEELAVALRLRTLSNHVDNVDWFYLETDIVEVYERSTSPDQFKKDLAELTQRWADRSVLIDRSNLGFLVRLAKVTWKQIRTKTIEQLKQVNKSLELELEENP